MKKILQLLLAFAIPGIACAMQGGPSGVAGAPAANPRDKIQVLCNQIEEASQQGLDPHRPVTQEEVDIFLAAVRGEVGQQDGLKAKQYGYFAFLVEPQGDQNVPRWRFNIALVAFIELVNEKRKTNYPVNPALTQVPLLAPIEPIRAHVPVIMPPALAAVLGGAPAGAPVVPAAPEREAVEVNRDGRDLGPVRQRKALDVARGNIEFSTRVGRIRWALASQPIAFVAPAEQVVNEQNGLSFTDRLAALERVVEGRGTDQQLETVEELRKDVLRAQKRRLKSFVDEHTDTGTRYLTADHAQQVKTTVENARTLEGVFALGRAISSAISGQSAPVVACVGCGENIEDAHLGHLRFCRAGHALHNHNGKNCCDAAKARGGGCPSCRDQYGDFAGR